jgi:ADP-ribose pyrophosphatase YjhB (NUDIX family)
MGLDPYGGGDPTPLTYWRPRESERGAYTEKKLGDELLAIWQTSELPADANVTHVTAICYRGDKAVTGYKNGQMILPEGDVQPGEDAQAAIRRIVLDQAGIQDARILHLGHFRATATNHHPTQSFGTTTYQVLFGLEVDALADNPGDSSYERRIILQRDLNNILRSSYVERRREYTDILDAWLLDRLKANLTK